MNRWQLYESDYTLQENCIDVWRIELNVSDDLLVFYNDLLSIDELDRAKRFRFKKDRDHFITGRAVLRLLLSKYLQQTVPKISFLYTEKGKPFVSNPIDLQFNLSHANGFALAAFSLKHPLGVDVEWINPKVEIDLVARHFFASGEIKRLFELPATQRSVAFFNCWTRKESFIKAIGDGLSFPLDQFEVSLQPEEDVELLATHWNQTEKEYWSLFKLEPGKGYRAALAIRQLDQQVFKWDWKH